MKKNIIIVLLLIGLLISGYFNYIDSKKVKIKVGTDSLNLIFYTTKSKPDSIASSEGRPLPRIVDTSASIRLLTTNMYDILHDPIIDCDGCIQTVRPAPGVHPTLREMFMKFLQTDKEIDVRFSISQ